MADRAESGGRGIDVGGAAAQRAVRLEQATIAYDVVEGVIAVAAGLAAGSVALVGFGVDSGIEVAAAAVVLWRLRATSAAVWSTRPGSGGRCDSSR